MRRVEAGFIETVGLELGVVSAERVAARLVITDSHLQPYGVVHGGVYATIGETLASVGGYCAVQKRDATMGVVGLENHTSFLRTVRAGATVVAEGTPVHAGGRVQLWRVTMRDEQTGRDLATSTVRLLVVDPETLPG